MAHKNCIKKGTVEPGYLYRKKMLYFNYINPIEEAKQLKAIKDQTPWGESAVEHMEAEGYGDEKTTLMKLALLKLPKQVQNWTADGRLKPTIAYLIYAIKNKKICTGLARRSITEKLSVNAVRGIMTDMRAKGIY